MAVVSDIGGVEALHVVAVFNKGVGWLETELGVECFGGVCVGPHAGAGVGSNVCVGGGGVTFPTTPSFLWRRLAAASPGILRVVAHRIDHIHDL